jgi:exopolysaccharide biosynthesis polyprenyl glycosylphosphotransferase
MADTTTIYGAFVLAYWLRYSLGWGPVIQEHVTFREYQPVALLLLAIMVPVLLVKGAYRYRLSRDLTDDFTTVFSAATIAVATVVVITFLAHNYLYSRGVIIYVWVLLIALVFLGRAVYRSVQAYCHRRGWGVRRLLVVGGTDVGKMIMQSVMSRPDLGYQLIGFADHRVTPQIRDFGRFRAVGLLSDVPSLIASGAVDDIVIALPAASHEEVWPLLTLCEQHGVGLKLVPDLFEMSLSRVEVDDIAGIPLLDVQERPLRRMARMSKRLIDVVLGTVLLVCAAPVLFVLGILIRAESEGPAMLRQTRVGLGGKTFTCYKLRTMWIDAENYEASLEEMNESDGLLFKIRSDPRCTPLGRRIRRLSMDELPQLWNVVRGDMSLVGPRPALPQQAAQYDGMQGRRLELKPGMTGIWQVSGRSDLAFDEMVLMDIYYVDNWSLSLDARILVRTLISVAGRHGAY